MQKRLKTYFILLLTLPVLSVFWMLAGRWNNSPATAPLLLILPSVIILASLLVFFRFAWKEAQRSFPGTETAEPDIQAPPLKKEKQLTKNENLNIEGIARKINREFDPAASPEENGKAIMNILSSELEIMSGIYYSKEDNDVFVPVTTFAFSAANKPENFLPGEGLNGQAVMNKQVMLLSDLPENFLKVSSGLGSADPAFLAFVPVMRGEEATALIECAGFRKPGKELDQLFNLISVNLSEKMTGAKNTENEK